MSLPSSHNRKDATVEPENCNIDTQNFTIFGVNIDPSKLLLPTVSRFSISVDPDVSSIPSGDFGFHNSLYRCNQDSSKLMHNARQID